MQTTRTDLAREVLAELSATVLRLGALLEEIPPGQLTEWAEIENIPISVYTLERIKAMAWCHTHARAAGTDLPEPWKALWSLD